MRRRLLALPLVAAALVAAPPAHAAKPTAVVKLTACTTGVEPAARAATFAASMTTIKGARQMAMRFELRAKSASGRWARVDMLDWGSWEKSEPGRPAFVFTRRVEGLAAPQSYRATVRFRWLDRKGRTLRSAMRSTKVCAQPDPRSDLRLVVLEGSELPGGEAEYGVVVENEGLSTAPLFDVVVEADGRPLAPVRVGPLAPGARERGRVRGPRCAPGSTVRITLDAGGTVAEAREGQGAIARPCPFTS